MAGYSLFAKSGYAGQTLTSLVYSSVKCRKNRIWIYLRWKSSPPIWDKRLDAKNFSTVCPRSLDAFCTLATVENGPRLLGQTVYT